MKITTFLAITLSLLIEQSGSMNVNIKQAESTSVDSIAQAPDLLADDEKNKTSNETSKVQV